MKNSKNDATGPELNHDGSWTECGNMIANPIEK